MEDDGWPALSQQSTTALTEDDPAPSLPISFVETYSSRNWQTTPYYTSATPGLPPPTDLPLQPPHSKRRQEYAPE